MLSSLMAAACFCSIPGSTWNTSAPHLLLSDPEIKPVESISPGRELLEKPGVPVRKAADSLPPPAGCAGAGEATRLGTSQCPAQGRTVRGGGDWVPSLAV